MKICCDVCCKQEATLFCYSDEAALCDVCDLCVHHANKVATQHSRFPLLQPKFNDFSFCDVCQERRGYIFCQEDRAILCIKCDLQVHEANEYTQKHKRFLLTSVKLSSSSSNGCCSNTVSNNEILSSPSVEKPVLCSKTYSNSDNASVSMSSTMSEYFMETIPGWLVDDFLQPSSPANGFCKDFFYKFDFLYRKID
ncbi:B BOX 21, B-box domain protein 21, long hypocotyl under shade, salt tolerance homolog2 [Hibiscus trionum]|uniref:B BOX 21, B-box domain protein 21, long hypocotyl under shade, salt tolerance homolog2 n=1 Tax=Hibiscus trionum TaxID=183268 RepID=A0A9W7MPJ1_HIBTR|nr:B BOX 21, B-box domain protein 21, long hypocotyl under shade, salt tolerance homolog2 [Hibiscus trionum]